MENVKIFSGSSCSTFAQKVSRQLNVELGEATLTKFMNGETRVEIHESVRGKHVFIVQSGSGDINDNIMEMLIMIHSCKISSSRRITAVIPCFPYARQDKKEKSRAPITAKLIANMLCVAGADHIITMDLHASQVQGFFDMPVDNLQAYPTLLNYVRENIRGELVIVSPDAGGAKRASYYADALGADLAIIHKERKAVNQVNNMILVGDVAEKTAILVDDIADTSRTLIMASQRLLESGATQIYALVTHPVLSADALRLIHHSPITKLVVVDTIELSPQAADSHKIESLTVSHVFSEAIRRIVHNESLSSLFLPQQPNNKL